MDDREVLVDEVKVTVEELIERATKEADRAWYMFFTPRHWKERKLHNARAYLEEAHNVLEYLETRIKKTGNQEVTTTINSPASDALVEESDSSIERTIPSLTLELEEMGVAAVPGLIEALRDDDDNVHVIAAETLANIGAAAVPGLIEVLRDDDDNVHVLAAETLAKIWGKIAPKQIEAQRHGAVLVTDVYAKLAESIFDKAQHAVKYIPESEFNGVLESAPDIEFHHKYVQSLITWIWYEIHENEVPIENIPSTLRDFFVEYERVFASYW